METSHILIQLDNMFMSIRWEDRHRYRLLIKEITWALQERDALRKALQTHGKGTISTP